MPAESGTHEIDVEATKNLTNARLDGGQVIAVWSHILVLRAGTATDGLIVQLLDVYARERHHDAFDSICILKQYDAKVSLIASINR